MSSLGNKTFSTIKNAINLPITLGKIPSAAASPEFMLFQNPEIAVDFNGRIVFIEESTSSSVCINSISSVNTDQLLVTGTPTEVELSIVSGPVTSSGQNLVSANQIFNYVNTALAGGPLIYQGGYNASTNSPNITSPAANISKGWTYTVTAPGSFYSENVEIGDMLIAEDAISAGTGSLSDWTTVQSNVHVATTSAQGIVYIPPSGGLVVSGRRCNRFRRTF